MPSSAERLQLATCMTFRGVVTVYGKGRINVLDASRRHILRILVRPECRTAAEFAVIGVGRRRDLYGSHSAYKRGRRIARTHRGNPGEIPGCPHLANKQRRCSSRNRALYLEVCFGRWIVFSRRSRHRLPRRRSGAHNPHRRLLRPTGDNVPNVAPVGVHMTKGRCLLLALACGCVCDFQPQTRKVDS